MAETLHKVTGNLLKDEVTLIWRSQAREEQPWTNLTALQAISRLLWKLRTRNVCLGPDAYGEGWLCWIILRSKNRATFSKKVLE